jgi:F420-dependent oxidoreductase-like protein
MRVGVFVSETWAAPSTLAEVQARAAEAQRLGFANAWVPYLPWAVDPLMALTAAAAVTSTIELGTAVIPTYFFHPLALARQAFAVDDACRGRLTLGIGPSQPSVVEKMHGIPYVRPAQHTREYIEVLRAAAAGHSKVTHSGELYQIDAMFGAPTHHDKQRIPILVGALGPLMLRVAGELGDGTIATSSDEGAIERVIVPGITAAATAAGRPAPRVGTVLAIGLTDRATALDGKAAVQQHFATYERIPRYARMLELGDKSRMGDVHIVGDEAYVRSRLAAFAGAGLTDLLAAPFTFGDDAAAMRRRTLELLADIAARGT